MKRVAFTMIELVFVIVVLGILSAIALPKFVGVSQQARAGKCQALIGTLNRTVLPTIWSDAVLNYDTNVSGQFTATKITAQIDIPKECGTAAQYANVIDGNHTFSIEFGEGNYTVSEIIPPSTSSSPTLNISKI